MHSGEVITYNRCPESLGLNILKKLQLRKDTKSTIPVGEVHDQTHLTHEETEAEGEVLD